MGVDGGKISCGNAPYTERGKLKIVTGDVKIHEGEKEKRSSHLNYWRQRPLDGERGVAV